jgi:deoxyribodipyrimidine photo-lyase
MRAARDQDPEGVFIRRYLPELARVPQGSIHQPHTMSASEQRRAGCIIGKDYPEPIVEHAAAYRVARQRIAAIQRQEESQEEAERVYQKHGSRRRPRSRRSGSKRA